MPSALRDALKETFEDWKSGVPRQWRPVIDDVQLAAEDVPAELTLDPWIPIFPALPGQAKVLGAPRYADTFRAFRDVGPQDVRAVVVGQDPYPDVAKATGLSFEQGNLRDWVQDDRLVSKSLRRIIQAAAAEDAGDEAYLEPKGWSEFIDDTAEGRIRPRSPGEFFNETREQGVLWLNTTLSISLFRGDGAHDHQPGHRVFWKPMIDAVLQHLASRQEGCVFVLWGSWARDLKPALQDWASGAGAADRVGFTEASHPVTKGFFSTNPISDVNLELEHLGLDPIDWL